MQQPNVDEGLVDELVRRQIQIGETLAKDPKDLADPKVARAAAEIYKGAASILLAKQRIKVDEKKNEGDNKYAELALALLKNPDVLKYGRSDEVIDVPAREVSLPKELPPVSVVPGELDESPPPLRPEDFK